MMSILSPLYTVPNRQILLIVIMCKIVDGVNLLYLMGSKIYTGFLPVSENPGGNLWGPITRKY